MRTATCALVADTSKFDGPIDSAKAKLSAFGQAVRVASTALNAMAALSAPIVDTAQKIVMIKQAFEIVRGTAQGALNVIKNFPSIMAQARASATALFSALRNIHPALLAISAGGIVVVGGMYALIKALQGVVSISKSVVVSLKNVAVSLASISARAVSSVGSGVINVFRGFGSIIGKVGIALGGLGISLGALDRFFKIGITSAIELGDSMKNLSARTGASIPFLFDMQKLFKNSGISADYAGNAMLNMQRALSGVNADGEPTNQMFERLGLSVESLMAMSPENAFKAIGTSIANLGSASEKTAASFAIFGRQGGGLKAVFKDPAFAQLGGNFSQLGLTLAKNADNFSKISSKLRDSGSFFRGFFVEMAGAVAPSILELFKLFEGGDKLSGFGKKLGDQIAFGVNALVGAFRSGKILDLLKATFDSAVMILKDLLTRTFEYASNVFTSLMGSSAIPKIGNALKDIFSASVDGLVQMLLGGFSDGIATLQAGLQIVTEDMSIRLDGIFGKFVDIGKEFLKAGGGITGALTAFGKATSLVSEKRGISPERAAEILSERQAQGGQFFGINLTASSFAENLKKIGASVSTAILEVGNGFEEIQDVLARFPPQSEEAKNAWNSLTKKITEFSSAGKPLEKAIEEATGTAALGAPRARAGTGGLGAVNQAVSSLQRIGGGGGAFAGDPLLAEAAKQTSLTQQLLNETKKLTQKAEKSGGLEAGGFSYAVLA
jgi:hypothetical protein